MRSINNNKIISEILNLPNLKILINSSFKKLFRYTVSCYGKHNNSILINLMIQNLIETSDKKEEILNILTNNGWNKQSKSFKNLSFEVLRKNIMPQILNLYSKEKYEINTCFNSEDNCNSFVHINVNNYDLHQLNTFPKRVYSYDPPNIYPNIKLNDMENKETFNKLFDLYRFDKKRRNIIKILNNNTYLNKYLIDIDTEEFIENINYGKEITKTDENFQLLLEYIRKERSLPYNTIFKINEKYTEEQYNDINKINYTDSRLLKYLESKLDKDYESEKLESKLPKSLTNPDEMPLDYDRINYVHYKTLNNYYNQLLEDKLKIDMEKSFEQIFSEYIKIYKNDIEKISKFLFESNYTTKDQKQRFEKIF